MSASSFYLSTTGRMKALFGVLILHGFGSGPDSVRPVADRLTAAGIPVQLPCLPGHGADVPDALGNVRWEEWVDAAQESLDTLSALAERVVVTGHSMGALIAVQLSVKNPDLVAGLCLAAPAFLLKSIWAPGQPMSFFFPLLSILLNKADFSSRYADAELASGNTNYPWVPLRGVAVLFDFVRQTRLLVSAIDKSVFILQSRNDHTVSPGVVSWLAHRIRPALLKTAWLNRSDHQYFRDCDSKEAIGLFVKEIIRMGNPKSGSMQLHEDEPDVMS